MICGTTSVRLRINSCSLLPRVWLVGNLVKVAERLGSLAVQTSDGQVDLLERPEHFINLLGLHQGGEVKHHADADAGPDVGRAGSQVAQCRAEGVGQFFAQAGHRSG